MQQYTVHRVDETGETVEEIGYVNACDANEADKKAYHQYGPRISIEEDVDTTDPAATVVIYKARGDDTADVYHESSACAEGSTELILLEEAKGTARPCENCVTETY
ncbi:hypothetical protein GLU01_01470 [Nanohaloarchaea archaeon]|jgi:hypothetical protein|nr:hypothetical protein [Candidatus Nanohaloarchaea archaeon]